MNVPKVADVAQWNRLVESYYTSILRYATQFLGSLDEAYDAAQDTFLKAYRSKSPVLEKTEGEEVKFWLYRICRNVCIDRRRWWKRFTNFRSRLETDSSWPPSDVLSLTLREAIRKLPEKQREVFILRHWHGFNTAETAKLLSIGEGTVKSHLSRAISRLKQQLRQMEQNQL